MIKGNKQLKMRLSDNESSEFAWYSSYETLGAVDGPGLRLIIFLQGCPVRCLFCHNPETTPFGIKELKISIDEVVELHEKNKSFYSAGGGGVTLSGGESLSQPNFVIGLFKKLKEIGVHTALDTACGPIDLLTPQQLNDLIKYTDLFIIDIKHPDNDVSIKLTGNGNQGQIDFIKLCEQEGKKYWIRHVYLPTYSDAKPEYMINLGRMIGGLKHMERFEMLPYHNMAVVKYENLGWAYQLNDIEPPTPEQIAWGMEHIKKGQDMVIKDSSKALI